MASTLYCSLCQVGFAVTGIIPIICPSCQRETKWMTDLRPWPFPLSVMDRKFLKSIKISPESEIPS